MIISLIALLAIPADYVSLDFGGGAYISLMRVMILAALFVGATKLSVLWASSLQILKQTNRYLLLFILLVLFSLLWTINFGYTFSGLYRFLAFLGIGTAFCTSKWDNEKLPKLLIAGTSIITVGSIIFVFFAPDIGIEQSVFGERIQFELLGSWKGITFQKNTLGVVAAIGFVVSYWEVARGTRRSVLVIAALAASLICLLKSRSSTSIIAALFSAILIQLMITLPAIKNRGVARLLIYGTAGTMVIYSLAILNLVPGLSSVIGLVVASVGKDMSFSGRTAIWEIMSSEVAKHPILGTGYHAYWTGSVYPAPSAIFKIRLYFYPSEAHNGYLDILNELGIAGLFTLLGFIYSYLKSCITTVKLDRSRAALYSGIIFMQIIGNLTESYWMNTNTSACFVMILSTLDMARYLHAKQSEAAVNPEQVRR